MGAQVQQREVNPFANVLKQAASNPQKILWFFPETNLGNGHNGLTEIAKEEADLDPKDLQEGQFLVFLNRACTQVKMYAPGNVIAHFKMPSGAGRINPQAIKFLPRVFNGKELNYTQALDLAIREAFNKN